MWFSDVLSVVITGSSSYAPVCPIYSFLSFPSL